jgi:hypothetical protein
MKSYENGELEYDENDKYDTKTVWKGKIHELFQDYDMNE